MSKIEPGDFFASYNKAHIPQKKLKSTKKEKTFSNLLKPQEPEKTVSEDSGGSNKFDTIDAILDEIHTSGDRLLQSPTFSALKKYRSAVQHFFRQLVRGGVELRSVESKRDILNRKRYTIISVVDEKLEQLAKGILESQAAQIDIAEALEEIHGLLVDIWH